MFARIAARTSCRGEQGKTSMRIGLVVCLFTVLVVAGRRCAPEKGGSFRLSGSFFAQCLEDRTRNEMYWGIRFLQKEGARVQAETPGMHGTVEERRRIAGVDPENQPRPGSVWKKDAGNPLDD